MTRPILFLLPSLSLFASSTSSAPLPTNTPNLAPRIPSHSPCDCYLVSGSDPGYFTNYKFWDFRNVSLPHSPGDKPNAQDPSNAWEAQTTLLSESTFKNEWHAQSWSRDTMDDSTVSMANSHRNAFFAPHPQIPDTTQLVLRTTQLSNYSSTAEIESLQANFYRCSLRVRMRLMSRDAVSGVPGNTKTDDINKVPKGACAGIFTYRSASCESDLEFLTSDPPNTIHYANQPDYDAVNSLFIPNASQVVTTLPSPWSSWVTHRMDWLANATVWYADNKRQASVTYGVPDRPSILALNLWSDGGSWTGDMAVNQSVYMGIEWIEVAYNTSTVDISPILTTRRRRHRPFKRENRNSEWERQIPGNQAVVGSCARPCYLDKMQHY
ncbi:glycoside hydrolase family 16 protein [Aspergillus lucknowensis]|uniref:Concanavalin A-like lectin/glucanase domain-containing protein n=1 Tax=Aspergillus lucknowensis TaxID=176173 RepID=A0ABR4LCJ1_9EURO